MIQLAVAIALLVAAYFVAGFFAQRLVIYPRYSIPDVTAGPLDERSERFDLDTPAGRVEALFLAGDGASAERPAPAVIFGHGNAERIELCAGELEPYRRLGIGVLLVEYRGYGRSAGSPSQRAITADFRLAYDRLAARPDVDADRIVFHGRSLGGGVVCSLAREREPAAIVLQSTFTSLVSFARRMLFPGMLLRDRFDSRSVLAGFEGPVLIFHGKQDFIVPFHHARELERAAPNAKLLAYECGHNDFPVDSESFWSDLEAFLRANGILDPRDA